MKYISKGAFHLHSTYSDGTGTIPEIVRDAKKAGLDWIIITDHNCLAGYHIKLITTADRKQSSVQIPGANCVSPGSCSSLLSKYFSPPPM